jgi:hypothetical protein
VELQVERRVECKGLFGGTPGDWDTVPILVKLKEVVRLHRGRLFLIPKSIKGHSKERLKDCVSWRHCNGSLVLVTFLKSLQQYDNIVKQQLVTLQTMQIFSGKKSNHAKILALSMHC